MLDLLHLPYTSIHMRARMTRATGPVRCEPALKEAGVLALPCGVSGRSKGVDALLVKLLAVDDRLFCRARRGRGNLCDWHGV